MKKLGYLLGCGLLLAACGGNQSDYDQYYNNKQEEAAGGSSVTDTRIGDAAGVNTMRDSAADATANTRHPEDFKEGARLISRSDCLSCHAEERRLVGPSYVEVAQKYAFNDKNVDYLAGKIIEGGAGVWGQVPMTPHPDLKQEQAREMARYILSLNAK